MSLDELPPCTLTLRPHQQEALALCLASLRSHRSTLVEMFTGGGKTSVFAQLVRIAVEHGRRVLVLVDGDELVAQVQDRLFVQAGISSALEKASSKAEAWCPCVVGSIKSVTRRLHRWGKDAFNLIIVDEAHHGVANTWKAILDHFSEAKVVGFTATGKRRDRRSLSGVFEHVCYSMDVYAGYKQGLVVPPRPMPIRVDGLDIAAVRSVAGDLDREQLDSIVRNVDILQRMAEPTFERVGSRQAIVFCCSVPHAYAFAALLRSMGATAEALDAKTGKTERKLVVERFRDGTTQYLCNYNIVSEGFDVPNASAIVMAALTKSQPTYIQRVGRGLRPLPGIADLPTAEERIAAIQASAKPDALILDFLGNTGRHQLISLPRAMRPDLPPKVLELAESQTPDEQLHIFEVLDAAEEMQQALVDEAAGRQRMGVAYQVMGDVDPFGGDRDAVMAFLGVERDPRSQQPLFRGVSALKLARMKAMKIPSPEKYGDSDATSILQEAYRRDKARLCTVEQGMVLAKLGYKNDEIRRLPMKEASRIIERHWKDEERVGFAPMFGV